MSTSRTTPRHAAGVTLLEMVMTLAIVAVIISSITSAIVVIGRSPELRDDGVDAQTSDAAAIVNRITTDLALALTFIQRDADTVEFTVPDRDGDDTPENIRYAWSGSPAYRLERRVHLSRDNVAPPPTVLADDVRQFDLTYLLRTWGPPPPPPALESDPHLLLSHDEVPDPTATAAILITAGAGPTAQEGYRQSLLEFWGYSVDLIRASVPQETLDAALAAADVVYVPEDVDAADLAEKLTGASAGVVNEDAGMAQLLGIGAGAPAFAAEGASFVRTSHHITATSGEGLQSLFQVAQPVTSLGDDPAAWSPHLDTLATVEDNPALAVLEVGDRLFDADGSATQVLLLVVPDAAAPGAGHVLRETLLESWGYTVQLLDEGATQTAFDEAVARASVAYVCADVAGAALDTKLTRAPIGVVCEALSCFGHLGLLDGPSDSLEHDEIEVLDTSHVIAAGLGLEKIRISDEEQWLTKATGNHGVARVLARNVEGSMPPALAILDEGDIMNGAAEGEAAPARRVFMPWGGPDFDIGLLTDEGLLIMRQAVDWAAESDVLGFDKVFPGETGEDFDERHVATKVRLEEDGVFGSIAAYLAQNKSKDMRFGIYGDDAGEPGVLLAQTDEFKPPDGEGWRIADLLDPVALPAGDYWLAMGLHDKVAYFYDPAGGETRHAPGEGKDGLMSPWSGTDQSSTRRLSIFAGILPAELAAGRRVQLPWGGDAFDAASLDAHGQQIMQRAVQWAADRPDPFQTATAGDKDWIAQYVLPPLPENAVAWSIQRIDVCLRANGNLDGELIFEIRHADPDLAPSGEVIVASAAVDESQFDRARFQWYQLPLPALDDLHPEFGVCLVIRASRKNSADFKVDRAGGISATAGTHLIQSKDSGATWTAPNDTDDMRFYLYGTYSTSGEPQWP